MTADGFARQCAAKREGGNRYCLVCQGRERPPELEIIDPAEESAIKKHMDEGMGKISTGTCDNCKRKGIRVQAIKGEKICASCASLYGAIGNRPEAVERALAMLAPEMLGQAVPVAVESAALQRIAEIVGYSGTDGDGLIAAIEAATVKDSLTVATGHCERSEAISGGLLDLARAMGLPATTETAEADIWLAAMQMAAELEEAERADLEYHSLFVGMRGQIERQSADLKNIKSAIGLPEDAEVSEITAVIAELTQALDRFRNLAEAADKRADKFEQAAEQAQSSADLLLAEKNLAWERVEAMTDYIDPYREAVADFGLRILRGEVCLINAVR
jgi:hypothetical protein